MLDGGAIAPQAVDLSDISPVLSAATPTGGDTPQQAGSTHATVFEGTNGPDTFTFRAGTPGGTDHQVTFGGVTTTYDPAVVDTIVFHAHAGEDEAFLTGTGNADTADLGADGTAEMTDGTYTVTITGAEHIRVNDSAGADAAHLHDSGGNDVLVGRATNTYMSGSGYYIIAVGSDDVYAHATTGYDEAVLYDSTAADRFGATPEYAYMYPVSGGSSVNRVYGFDRVEARASTGYDKAILLDSAVDDRFGAAPEYAYMRSASGGAYFNRADGFDRVDARASTGYDTAVLLDSAVNDRLGAAPEFAYIRPVPGGAYFNRVDDFDRVEAQASTGYDTAILVDSPVNDRFGATPHYAYMRPVPGGAYINRVDDFDRVEAQGSTGYDTAILLDSAVDDRFGATPYYAYMYADSGGTRIYINRVDDFDRVEAQGSTGHDTAALYDSTAADRFGATPYYAYMRPASGGAYINRVDDFDRVEARASVGADVASLFDSTAGDTFQADNGWAKLYTNDLSTVNWVSGFGTVHAYGTAGGTNTILVRVPLSALPYTVVPHGSWGYRGVSTSITYLTDVAFGPAATVEIELRGRQPGAEHDQIVFLGESAWLDGTLNVSLINAFNPGIGDSFRIFDFDALTSGVVGGFHTLVLPSLTGGLGWNADDLYAGGTLRVFDVAAA